MSYIKNSEQIQIRIDAKTKKQAKKVLENLGLDMSSAVKLFFRQLIIAGNFPCELRDENGFTLKNADALRQALQDAPGSKRSFRTGRALVKDALKD